MHYTNKICIPTHQQLIIMVSLCSVALCLPLPLFTCLFYVNSFWHGVSLCPRLGSHISLVTLFCDPFPISLTIHKLFYVHIYGICQLLSSHQSHATFFSSLTTSVTIHMAIYCQYVLASGVSLALSPFGRHKPPVSSLLMCIVVTSVHLSLMQTVTCLTIVSHFTLHLFASSCLLSYLLINTLLAAYVSLFAPY